MSRFYGKPLTKHEKKIAVAYALDLTIKDLKERFRITLSTAQSHTSRIYAKLGINDRLQLAAWCMREKLISPEEFSAIEPKSMFHAD